MAWIKVYQTLPQNKKVMRLKNILKIKAAHAAGHLIFLWLWAIDNAPDGDLSGLSAGDIAEISGWSGKKAEVFMDALIEAGFLDPDMKIHDWYEYAGKLIDQRQIQREQSRIRQQRHREKIANTSNDNALVTRDIDVSNADVTHSRVEKSKSRVDIYSLDGGISIDQSNKDDPDTSVSTDTKPQKRFVKPTLEEVQAYCRERNNNVDAEKWYDHYTANGWKVGKNPMKDWKASIRTWERSDCEANSKKAKPSVPMDAESKARQEVFEKIARGEDVV